MIFTCRNENCNVVVESNELITICSVCGERMKVITEEQLDGLGWTALGEYWSKRDENDLKAQKRSFYCFQRASMEGEPRGITSLGMYVENGWGTEKDEAQAFWIYQQAAEYGYVPAFYQLGCCYQLGKGIDVDLSMAFMFFMKAARFSYPLALLSVSRFFEEGIVVDRNEEQAFFVSAACIADGLLPHPQRNEGRDDCLFHRRQRPAFARSER